MKIKSLPFNKLDEFALIARQNYNLGNETDWFGFFRGGLFGFYSRVYGIGEHFSLLHEWLPPRLHLPEDTEYHLSSVLFGMASAIECLTFALNALGFAAQPDRFLDVTRHEKLNRISLTNIIGNPASQPPTKPLVGYTQIYPTLQCHCAENREFLGDIFNLHNVSKHRETIYTGGQLRADSPPGFFEALGVDDNNPLKMLYCPHETIILPHEPKAPRSERSPITREEHHTLENIVPRFLAFLQQFGELALNDVRVNIELKRFTVPSSPTHAQFLFNHVPDGVWE